jgi:sulfide dehydrogenase cytochrome subunit
VTTIGFAAAAVLLGLAVSVAPARAEMASGQILTYTCFSCHGTDGESVGEMPTIAGKSEKFIREKLQAFKSGELQGTVMTRIAMGFSDPEITALAKYFAGGQ